MLIPPAHRRVNCSEYFPLFLATLWVAGIFFHEGRGVGCGAGAHALDPLAAAHHAHEVRAHLSQGRRRCAAWSTCSRASATSRATPAPRSSGEGRAGSGAGPGKGRGWAGSWERGPSWGRRRGRSPAPLGIRWASPGGGRRKSPRGRGWGGEEAGPSRATAPLTAARRLAPLYASARALWLLVALAALGLLAHFLPAALRAALLGRLRTLLPWA